MKRSMTKWNYRARSFNYYFCEWLAMEFKELAFCARKRRTCSERYADGRMFDKKNDDLDSRSKRGEIKNFAASSNKRSEDNETKKTARNWIASNSERRLKFHSHRSVRRGVREADAAFNGPLDQKPFLIYQIFPSILACACYAPKFLWDAFEGGKRGDACTKLVIGINTHTIVPHIPNLIKMWQKLFRHELKTFVYPQAFSVQLPWTWIWESVVRRKNRWRSNCS